MSIPLNRLTFIVAFLLLFTPMPGRADSYPLPAAGTVVKVIDGDTLRVVIKGKKEKVRLLGIDTPEVTGPYTKAEPFGTEASTYTKTVAGGKEVMLLFEGETKRDRYGRLLAHVILPDGTTLNERLLAAGLARYYRKFKYSRKKRYQLLERSARDRCVGMWAVTKKCRKQLPQ